MKYTKIISSLILAGAFVFSFNADAADEAKKDKKKKPAAGQSAKGKKGGRKNPYASLELSKEQQGKMRELQKARGEALKKAREAKDRKAMGAANKAFQDGLKELLSEEQLGKLKAIRPKWRRPAKARAVRVKTRRRTNPFRNGFTNGSLWPAVLWRFAVIAMRLDRSR